MAMMAITTSSSISVNPVRKRLMGLVNSSRCAGSVPPRAGAGSDE
jgi:hypothetical protein